MIPGVNYFPPKVYLASLVCSFTFPRIFFFAIFSTSFEKFDKAISDFFIDETDNLEGKAANALIELNTKAVSFRLSSLVKNDAELMTKALEIADFSGREMDNLKAYKQAIKSKNADSDGLANECGDLTGKRKTAYARFQKLAGLKD